MPAMKFRRSPIGLALGGGGARGLAHIGVLKVFEEKAIPVNIIAGTSIGALVGGAYASGSTPDEIEKKTEDFLSSPDFQSSAIKAFEDAQKKGDFRLVQKIQVFIRNRLYLFQAIFKPGILPGEDLQSMIEHFIPDIDVEETRIPFRPVATDLVTGKEIIFTSGSLRQAVTASCAVPGAVAPLKEGEMILSDGGIICSIPTSVLKEEGAGIVLAVAVDRQMCEEHDFSSAMKIYYRVSDIMSNRLKSYELMDADVVILPRVGTLHWSEFSQARDLVAAGETAAREKLNEIFSVLPLGEKWVRLKNIINLQKKWAFLKRGSTE